MADAPRDALLFPVLFPSEQLPVVSKLWVVRADLVIRPRRGSTHMCRSFRGLGIRATRLQVCMYIYVVCEREEEGGRDTKRECKRVPDVKDI